MASPEAGSSCSASSASELCVTDPTPPPPLVPACVCVPYSHSAVNRGPPACVGMRCRTRTMRRLSSTWTRTSRVSGVWRKGGGPSPHQATVFFCLCSYLSATASDAPVYGSTPVPSLPLRPALPLPLYQSSWMWPRSSAPLHPRTSCHRRPPPNHRRQVREEALSSEPYTNKIAVGDHSGGSTGHYRTGSVLRVDWSFMPCGPLAPPAHQVWS